MKRSVCLLVAAVMILTGSCPIHSLAKEETVPKELESLYARSAVLMDGDSGRVLFGKEEDVKRPMASTTKIMTCIVALEEGTLDQVLSVSEEAASQPKVRLGVQKEDTYYLGDILYSLMLESHNDSAVVVAEGIAGSAKDFASMMNHKAEELGCDDTHFVTPNGLDGCDGERQHSTTARDLARIMKYCVMDSPKKEEFLEITETKSYSFQNIEGTKSFSCHNHNAFLQMMDGALSGKTGFTAEAGYCYVGALRRDGRTFIVALLACGWPNNKTYKWADTKKLMSYGLDHYTYQNVWKNVEKKKVVVENGIPDLQRGEEQGSGSSTVTTAVEKGELAILLGDTETVTVKVKRKKRIKAPVKKGEQTGTVTYMLKDNTIGVYPIVTTKEVKARTFWWCLGKTGERLCLLKM